MLPTRLLSYRRSDEGALLPAWLTARDEVWLRELAAEAAASDGRRADVADERILDQVAPIARRHGSARRVVEAVWLVERRRWKSRVDAPAPPEQIRRIVFDLAAERSREEAIATAASELGLPESAIEGSLFADRAGARKLIAPAAPCSSGELLAAYNLSLVQAFLARSTEVVALVRANVRPVVSYAKLHGLMAKFDETTEGVTRISISGPLALFHDTLKYGRALATWFPSVVATPGWSIVARVVLGQETLRLALDGTAPLPRTHAMARAHDSKLEARLEKDLRRLSSPWTVVRESAVVRAGDRIFFPDFGLTANGQTVLVEVVGFWTPEYLAHKASLLRAATVPFVLCVDERHADGAFTADPRVISFRRSIDAASLIAACERAIAAAAPVVAISPASSLPKNKHYMVIAGSCSIKEHAVRGGARPERWREDVFEDLTGGHAVRLIVREPHPHYGRQVGILGRTFYAEANLDGRRDDTLFVHRVMTATKRPLVEPRTHAASFELSDTGAALSAARLDRIVDLLEPGEILRG